MASGLSWFKLVLKQLAPAQDQLKPAAMLQNIHNQHMLESHHISSLDLDFLSQKKTKNTF